MQLQGDVFIPIALPLDFPRGHRRILVFADSLVERFRLLTYLPEGAPGSIGVAVEVSYCVRFCGKIIVRGVLETPWIFRCWRPVPFCWLLGGLLVIRVWIPAYFRLALIPEQQISRRHSHAVPIMTLVEANSQEVSSRTLFLGSSLRLKQIFSPNLYQVQLEICSFL